MAPLVSRRSAGLCRSVSVVALLCVMPHVAAGQALPPPSSPSLPPLAPPLPPTASAAGACTIVGPLLTPVDFGIAPGEVLADASAVRLADGRVRLYMFGQGQGVVSAVSVAADGAAFLAEPGTRLPDGSGMPRAVAAPAGGVRLFFTSGSGIKSALSADGLTFTPEAGFRMTAEAAGFIGTTAGATSGATIVRLVDGRYRMYFSDLPRPGDLPGGHFVKSAVSADQLTWTVEDGVRLGPGAPVLTDSAEHPFALANGDGSVTLYYGKFSGPGSATTEGLYHATSNDGVTFTTEETYDIFFGNDPDAVRLVDGTLAMYYGQFDPRIGGSINLARCPEPAVPAPSPSPAP